MSQSLVQIYVHIVFSTKGRRPMLQDEQLRERVHAYLAKTCHNQGAPSIIVGGVEDHIHALCRLAKVLSISDLLKELKRESSKWIKKQSPALHDFYWQSGYGAFSVGPSEVRDVTAYIANQKEHHRKETFQDEFRRLCRQYGVDLDERYAWD